MSASLYLSGGFWCRTDFYENERTDMAGFASRHMSARLLIVSLSKQAPILPAPVHWSFLSPPLWRMCSGRWHWDPVAVSHVTPLLSLSWRLAALLSNLDSWLRLCASEFKREGRKKKNPPPRSPSQPLEGYLTFLFIHFLIRCIFHHRL